MEFKHCCAVSRNSSDYKKDTYSNIASHNTSCFTFPQNDMIYIPSQTFLMGTNDKKGFSEDYEGPVRTVHVPAYYIDAVTVTNASFATFIEDTGYQTDAEKFGWSFVFYMFVTETCRERAQQVQGAPWWLAIPQANWKQPEGEGSSIDHRLDHPVTHVSWQDANAYCQWAKKRLPTEPEWELAARGGLTQKKFPWGNQLKLNGEHQCNIWQGSFPTHNTGSDGYIGTAPVQSYSPNGLGLYNVSGNVWEWCANAFEKEPTDNTLKAMRGGSYLCHRSYCNRYRVAARSANTADSSTGNIGFRCVADIPS